MAGFKDIKRTAPVSVLWWEKTIDLEINLISILVFFRLFSINAGGDGSTRFNFLASRSFPSVW